MASSSSVFCHLRARLGWLIVFLLLSIVAIHQKQVLSVPKYKEAATTDQAALFSRNVTTRDNDPPVTTRDNDPPVTTRDNDSPVTTRKNDLPVTTRDNDCTTKQENRTVLSSHHHSVLDVNSKGGFVLAYHFWEQLTSSSKNLLHLQCWARKLNMSVLEPSVRESYFGTDYNTAKLRFRDIYDMDHWASLSHNNTLVSWNQFLKAAPRKLIRVSVVYAKYKTQKGDHCTFKPYSLLEKHKFRTVRQVCIEFSDPKEFSSLTEFNKKVFGGYSPSRTTVMFDVWRGFGRYRVQIRDPDCEDFDSAIRHRIHFSPRIVKDAEKYKAMYLKASDYVAVMARMEKSLRVEKNSTGCFQQTISMWKEMVRTSSVRRTFLSADIGRFGSASFSSTKEGLKGDFRDFLRTLYGRPVTVSQWEYTFQAVSGVSNPAYIGVLQKALAARAKCLLLVGGGNFQQHALELYLDRHTEDERCVYIVKSCTNQQLQYSV